MNYIVNCIFATFTLASAANAQDLEIGDFENNKSWWGTWGGKTSIVANPFSDGNAKGNVLKYEPDSVWRGISIYFVEPPLKPYHKRITFDVYADTSTAVQLGFPSSGDDTLFIKKEVRANGWRHLEFDLSGLKSYKYRRYIIIQTVEITTYYFDNIRIVADSTYTEMPTYITDSISIYPNPCRDYINCIQIQDNTTLRIFNLAGKLVYKKKVNNNERVPIFNLKNGFYSVEFEYNGERSYRKIIKI